MTKEQAQKLKEYLMSAASSAQQLVTAIDAAGPIDFEADSDDRTDLLSDIEFDLSKASELIEAL